jgi:hypothetical protein
MKAPLMASSPEVVSYKSVNGARLDVVLSTSKIGLKRACQRAANAEHTPRAVSVVRRDLEGTGSDLGEISERG